MVASIGRERKLITVLFADVVDSTALAEAVDAEDWADTMNGAFDLMAGAVHKYEGTVGQFLGDGILAFFGAPVAHEDDPQRAVRAGLDMLEAVARLASERRDGRANVALRLRIGINTGPVILGNVGNIESGAYSAMGDTLNTAARVQSVAAPSTVAVTEDTYRLVSAVFDGDDLGMTQVKGKAAPVHCYSIRGLHAHRLVDRVGAEDGPMIGRDGQLARLLHLTSAVQKGRGGAVFVIGEPGIGKSRLIREVKSSVSRNHPELIWLEGRAVSYGSSVPYGLVLQIVRSMFGAGLATEPSAATEAVAGMLEDFVGPSGADLYPYLAHLLSIPAANGGVPDDIEPEALQQRYVDSLTSLLGSAAAVHPVVIVCDDLHWADASSVALLSKLLEIAAQSRMLFIFSSRRDPQSNGWRLLTAARDTFGEALTELNLDPLSAAQASDLAQQLLGDSPSASSAAQLYEATEGNPLFIEEVVRTYLSPDSSFGVDWNGASKGALLEGSPSLHSLLLSSIDRLPEDTRRVLKLASVVGREFAVELLETVAQETDGPLDVGRQLSSLEAAGLIRIGEVHPELQYSFRHALLQEAAYGSLLKSERKKLHAAIGTALEAAYLHRVDELAGLLARHFGEAGDDERAFSYSVRAADAAFSRYATSEAVVHYERAVEIGARSAGNQDRLAYLSLRLGRSLELTDRYDEAVGAYQRLVELGRVRDAPDLELAGLLAGATALVTPSGRQDIDETERLARRALALARQTGDRSAESRSLWNLMLAHNFSGRDPALSIKFGEESLTIARQLGGAEQVASTLLDLHWAYLGAGQIDQSFQALDEAIGLWRRLGDKAMLADSVACSSGLKLFVGDLAGAVLDAEEARAVSEQAGSLWGQAFARMYSGYALYELGRTGEAIDVMRDCIRLAEQSSVPGQLITRADLGLVLAQTGAADEGLSLAQRAFDQSLAGWGKYKAWAAAALAQIHVLMGNPAKAASVLELVDAETDGSLYMPGPARFPLGLARAEVALAMGDAPHSLSLSGALEDELARLHLKFWLPQALILQARAKKAMGEDREAKQLLEKARFAASGMGATRSLQSVLSLLDA